MTSSDQADAHLTELMTISEGPPCMALNRDGFLVLASSVRIFSDSQSALLSVQSWRASACQGVVEEIIRKLRMSNITLYWIPGHSGAEGNEQADMLAKAATREESEEQPQQEGVPWYLTKLALKRANITEGPVLPGKADTGKYTKKTDVALHPGKSAEMY